MTKTRTTLLAAALVLLALVASACGSDLHGGDSAAHDDQDSHPEESSDAEGHGGSDPAPDVEDGQFPTVGFEVVYETSVEFAPSDVCPLYEPSGRFLLYDDWDPTVLREAEGDTLVGLITTSLSFGLEVILTVTEHAPDEGRIQYVALWDDFEVQRIDISCTEGSTPDSTTVVWTERNAGLHEDGTSMVTTFIEAGGVGINAENYSRNISEYLANQ